MKNCAIHQWMLLEILEALPHLKSSPQITNELDIFFPERKLE